VAGCPWSPTPTWVRHVMDDGGQHHCQQLQGRQRVVQLVHHNHGVERLGDIRCVGAVVVRVVKVVPLDGLRGQGAVAARRQGRELGN
jgi:hypothetical protein